MINYYYNKHINFFDKYENKFNFYDKKFDNYQKCQTIDGSTLNTKNVQFRPNHIKTEIINFIKMFNNFSSKLYGKNSILLKGVFHFKIDNKNKLWFMHNSYLEFDKTIKNKNNIFYNNLTELNISNPDFFSKSKLVSLKPQNFNNNDICCGCDKIKQIHDMKEISLFQIIKNYKTNKKALSDKFNNYFDNPNNIINKIKKSFEVKESNLNKIKSNLLIKYLVCKECYWINTSNLYDENQKIKNYIINNKKYINKSRYNINRNNNEFLIKQKSLNKTQNKSLYIIKNKNKNIFLKIKEKYNETTKITRYK